MTSQCNNCGQWWYKHPLGEIHTCPFCDLEKFPPKDTKDWEFPEWSMAYTCLICGTVYDDVPVNRGPSLFNCPNCKSTSNEGWTRSFEEAKA